MIKMLPLCRKEKYYTSCILPQLICGDNMERLNVFLNFLNIDQDYIMDSYSPERLLFYTEYSLKESADWDELQEHSTKETPDLVILIKGKSKALYQLIVIEAKMFNKTSTLGFRLQLDLQKPLIRIMKQKVGVADENILHIGLLKQNLNGLLVRENERIILWKDILNIYKKYQNNYFYKVLDYAVNDPNISKQLKYRNHSRLVRDKNYQGLFTFDQLLQICEKEGDNIFVGYIGGKKALLSAPIEYLNSRRFKLDYRINSLGKKIKTNWILGSEFLGIISMKSITTS